jgi:dipeptidyl aminopeptidase/acylaminoacyl peptidase
MKARVFAIFLIVILGVYLYDSRDVSDIKTAQKDQQVVASLAPEPFEQLTIPYLRSRTYSSELGELKKYRDNLNYTSYLTSYDSDNLQINGLLTIPKGDGPHPAIVFVHGYIAPTIYQTTEKYGDYVDYLARNGYVVFKIDLRGHGESEGEATGSYYSGDYVIDTLNAYAALQKSEFVDPNRIGLWGHSMGGNVVFRSLVAKTDIPAAVIWAGAGYTYTDLLTYRISDNSYRPPQTSTSLSNRRTELRNKYGEFNEDSDFWRKVPGTNYLEGVQTAIQLNHSVDDNVVSVEYSRNLMKTLDSTTLVHELNEYQSGGHNISGSAFGQAMRETVDFYLEHMGK